MPTPEKTPKSEHAPVIPADAPRPTDHKSKTKKDKEGRLLVDPLGVEIAIDVEMTDDYEVLEWIGAAQEGDPTAMALLLKRLAGAEKHSQLKDAARDPETGRVSVEKMASALEEIFEALGN